MASTKSAQNESSARFDREQFERAKRGSVGQLLFKCARLLNERALDRVRAEHGLSGIRTSHTALFPHLELDGIRLTELARRMGVSKQAASQLVDEMVEMGALRRIPDPEDGRAKRIVLTDDGKRGLMAGLGVLMDLEREIAGQVGEEVVRDLHAGLTAVLDVLET